MKPVISPAWSSDDRLDAIRSIVEFMLARESGGLEGVAFRAIQYITYEEPAELNRLAAGELKLFIHINRN